MTMLTKQLNSMRVTKLSCFSSCWTFQFSFHCAHPVNRSTKFRMPSILYVVVYQLSFPVCREREYRFIEKTCIKIVFCNGTLTRFNGKFVTMKIILINGIKQVIQINEFCFFFYILMESSYMLKLSLIRIKCSNHAGGCECSPLIFTIFRVPICLVYAFTLHLQSRCFRQYQYTTPELRTRCLVYPQPLWVSKNRLCRETVNVASSLKPIENTK